MKKKEKAIKAHADFVRHDAHCPVCSSASRYGAGWKSHMCPAGLALYYRAQE